MKQRIKEIIKTLREVLSEECLVVSHDTLFRESLCIYRGEKANQSNPKKPFNKPTTPATDKQIAYAQQLADLKNIELNLTGKETSQQISKLIDELK